MSDWLLKEWYTIDSRSLNGGEYQYRRHDVIRERGRERTRLAGWYLSIVHRSPTRCRAWSHYISASAVTFAGGASISLRVGTAMQRSPSRSLSAEAAEAMAPQCHGICARFRQWLTWTNESAESAIWSTHACGESVIRNATVRNTTYIHTHTHTHIHRSILTQPEWDR